MKKQLFDFMEFSSFYKHYKPLSPFGVAAKNREEIFYDVEVLARKFENIEILIDFVKNSNSKSDKIEYHLKKIPELPSFERNTYDSVDFFQIKKFLINYREIVLLLTDRVKEQLSLYFDSQKLLDIFLKGGNDETFYLSENYSEELRSVRAEIREIDEELQTLKQKRIKEINENFGYDFSFRDFLVIEENQELKPDKDYFYIEKFDSRHVVVKPVFPDSYFELHKKKDQLTSEELSIETKVLSELSEKIVEEKNNLEKYRLLVETLDTTLAKARLAIKFNMTRPDLLLSDKKISVSKGRYIPQLERCETLETQYHPLSVSFSDRTVVIHGSNMSGKTVLLKSIGFFQILTQMGFYIPADKYSAPVFDQIFYIGENASEKIAGLSGFGLEIHNLMKAREKKGKKSLYLIDEFARTTNSYEAVALISALLKEFTEEKNTFAILSTHFMGLPDLKELSFYKMKGVDYEEYEKYYQKENIYTLLERIQLINSFMLYKVVPDEDKSPSFDAIKIAEILGLDKSTVEHAYRYLGGKDEK